MSNEKRERLSRPDDRSTDRSALRAATDGGRQPRGQQPADRHPDMTDAQLGLFPHEGDLDRVSDVVGPDGEDAELREGGELDLVSEDDGTPTRDGQEAGQPGRAEILADETDLTTTPHLLGEEPGRTAEVDPDFMAQPLFTDPVAAVGDPDDAADPVSDLDETYVPPMDPVITTDTRGDAQILGGFAGSGSEQIVPRRSSDGQIGDEALVDAVEAALRHDAATTDLSIEVSVVQGVVRLRGTVDDLDDAENAEAVASRVDGVVEVCEELEVASGQRRERSGADRSAT
ncbi:MAG: BON domain-containing protein [Chloroflexi bacterium]|nr:BON domain-containing protein [Chloroflexota bacterium]